jgi:multidrug resistance efflux pump
VEVEIAPATKRDISEKLELVGSFLPTRRTVVVAEVDGVIQQIPAPEVNPVTVQYGGIRETLPLGIGADVKKGDLLIKLDASDYELALKVAEAHLDKANRDLDKLRAWHRPEEIARYQALFDETEANVQRAEKAFDRNKRLIESNAVSRSDYEEKEAEVLKARALRAHAKAQLDIAKAGPTEEELAVAKAAVLAAEAEVKHRRWKVERTSIRAPYDATVTDRYADVGDRVTAMPRVEILEIMDIRYLFAEVCVPERYSNRISMMQQAVVRAQGVPRDIPGLVARINNKVDPATRTFRIRVAIDNSQRRSHVGQFVRVLLNLETSADALTVPRPAITYAGGQPHVFVYAENAVHLKQVQVGIQSEHHVEILGGLTENDQVVVQDPSVLSDGMPVRIKVSESVAQLPERHS